MLELYHHGSSVCAAKVRFALAEKGVTPDRYHYVDILKGEQFTEQYLRINPKAVVPTLVHDGRIITESTLICEYIDEVFDGASLKPNDAFDRYLMRSWTKAVDELLHPACSEVTYVCSHRHAIKRLPPAELEAYFDNTPERSVKGAWRARKRELVTLGFDAPGVESNFHLYDQHLKQMEEALTTNTWLAGNHFSLADVALAPYLNRLEMLSMSALWANNRLPRVDDWFRRIKMKPSFVPTFIDWCGKELIEDFKRNGAESWPRVQRIFAL